MTHSDLVELLAAYSIDALGPLDRLEVRAHLETCSACDEILRKHIETAAGLGLTPDPEIPTKGLRDHLMMQAAETAQILPIGFRKERKRAPLAFPAAVAMAMALVLGVFGGFTTSRSGNGGRFSPEILALLSSSGVNGIPMNSTGEDPDAVGQVFVPSDTDTAALIVTGLDDPGKDVYQLAVFLDQQTVPVRIFQPDTSGVVMLLIHKNLETIQGAMVTRELLPGLRVPTGKKILISTGSGKTPVKTPLVTNPIVKDSPRPTESPQPTDLSAGG